MYRVFLVEDEPFVLESLKAIIQWEAHGFRIAGDAGNGVDAYEKILAVAPDIVFTDIVMPRINGLELMQKVKAVNPDILFVVLSGYAEFSYALKAFSFGGLGYCLKPFDENEIAAVLAKAKDSLDIKRKITELKLIEILNEKQAAPEKPLEDILARLGFPCTEGSRYVVLVSIGPHPLRLPEEAQSLVIKLGPSRFACLVHAENRGRVMAAIQADYPDDVKGVGISEAACSTAALLEKINESTLAAYQYFMTGQPGVYGELKSNPDELRPLLRNLDHALEKKDMPGIMHALAACGDCFSRGSCSPRQAFLLLTTVMGFISKMEDYSMDDYSISYEELFQTFGTLTRMLVHLNKLVRQAFESGKGVIREDIKNETFMKIVSYIKENYRSEINLQSIARDYRINPSYISQLFKKELNTTYTDYVTNLRIKAAEDLLLSTSMQIAEVSEKVGFSDYFYFAKVFKKTLGMTPSEFKLSGRK